MTAKNSLCVLYVAVALQFGVRAGSAQTNQYLFIGSETNITLNPGLYHITAYGAQGGTSYAASISGGLGAQMEAEFSFTTTTTLTLLVGGVGGGIRAGFDPNIGAGGGGGSFVVSGTTPLVIAGGGGGAGPGEYAGQGNGGSGVVGPIGGSGGGYGSTGGSGGGGGGAASSFGLGGCGGGGYSGSGGGGGGGSSFLSGDSGGSWSWVPGGYGGGGGGGGGAEPGGGGGGGYSGGGGSDIFGAPGGGGGSYIDSSAVAVMTEISGVASPDDSPNGEIIITAVPRPSTLTYQAINGELVLNWVQGTLLSASTVNGTYTPVSDATSPFTNAMTVAQQYFRVLVGADATRKVGPGWTMPNKPMQPTPR